MKKAKLLSSLLIVGVTFGSSGCASRSKAARITNDVLAAGAGAVVGDKASGGNPYWTAAGAVGAVAAERLASDAIDEDRQKELARAFERGKAQNAQATYHAIQNAQKVPTPPPSRADGDDSMEIPITVPERVINGVKMNSSTEYVRITTR